ncbi:testis-expressed protein 26 [Strongylocentrotus purpuratus]|uniref:Testis-expressed protein 26 n=1 Tax=Strongylocentrotus purpuratus TaxID=7668 RepID=A0A7M7NIG3_STRPU|nr:testis-expressed protein 26 [Strongylocentrotus purpuratus]
MANDLSRSFNGTWQPTSTRPDSVTPTREYVTEINEQMPNSDFASDLAQFYPHASDADKQRCLELLASMTITDRMTHRVARETEKKKILQRPKTAIGSYGRPGTPGARVKKTMTSYRNDYPVKPFTHHQNARPSTTNTAYRKSFDPSGPVGMTHYNDVHGDKGYNKAEPYHRTGSSSGARKNNPHPFESFMVWKLPKNALNDHDQLYPHPLTDQMMEEIMRDKCLSTYQTDYLGIPQGYQVRTAMEDYVDWREKVPYSHESTTRAIYQAPRQHKDLTNNISRFGCNRNINRPSTGIVPNTSTARHEMHLRKATSYDHFYNKPFKPGTEQLSKALAKGKLDEFLRLADEKDRDAVQSIVRKLKKQPEPTKESEEAEALRLSGMSPTRPVTAKPITKFSWRSSWTGPL